MSRLTRRVERLEESKTGKRAVVCLYVGEGEMAEEAKARHLAEHPEHRHAKHFIIVEYRDPTKTYPVVQEPASSSA